LRPGGRRRAAARLHARRDHREHPEVPGAEPRRPGSGPRIAARIPHAGAPLRRGRRRHRHGRHDVPERLLNMKVKLPAAVAAFLLTAGAIAWGVLSDARETRLQNFLTSIEAAEEKVPYVGTRLLGGAQT